jgi:hypothetical protein
MLKVQSLLGPRSRTNGENIAKGVSIEDDLKETGRKLSEAEVTSRG